MSGEKAGKPAEADIIRAEKPAKNDSVDLAIGAVTNEGMGVGRTGGFVVFVPFTAPGDIARVRIVKVNKSYAYGRVEEILTASPVRVDSDCPAFGRCGGCQLRHVSYEAELDIKEKAIRDAFTKALQGELPEFLPIVPNPKRLGYRNKAQYPIRRNAVGKPVYGYFRTNSHDIVDCRGCVVQPAIFGELMERLITQVAALKIAPYNEAAHNGVLRHVCLRRGEYRGEVLVTLVARRKTPELTTLARTIRREFSEICGVVLNLNPDKTNVILGERELVLAGRGFLEDEMCGCRTTVSSKAFYQINTPAAETLYRAAAELCGFDEGKKTVLELYCGTGTIGLSVASRAAEVIGVEIVPEAVENAVENAEKNGFSNMRFLAADAGEAARRLLAEGLRPDVVLLDPARKGCGSAAVREIAGFGAGRIVMISCNPATAARDCAELHALGYRTVSVRGFDLFSGTGHVECVVLMARVDK